MKNHNHKLSVELVPSSSWANNVRSLVSKKEWDSIRKKSYQDANYRCEICHGVGRKHPVECHEIWEYNDASGVRKSCEISASYSKRRFSPFKYFQHYQ